jgi:hypothetical protein
MKNMTDTEDRFFTHERKLPHTREEIFPHTYVAKSTHVCKFFYTRMKKKLHTYVDFPAHVCNFPRIPAPLIFPAYE